MRQIFTSYPYIEPRVDTETAGIIRRAGRRLDVKAGEILKMPGALSHFYLVDEGVCGYFVAGQVFGHTRIMSLLLPGRTVADLSVSTGRPCNIETRALTDVVAWACPAEFFQREVYPNPQFVERLYRLAVQKHESTVEGMVANFTLPPEQRLKIFFRLLTYDTPQQPEPGWFMVPYRLTAETIGMVVNLTRSNVTRQLNAWREAGLARKEGVDWVLSDALFSDIYDWRESETDVLGSTKVA